MIEKFLPDLPYRSDPQQVKKILLEVAKKEPMVSEFQEPVVRFIEYGDSSLNFELLIWINVKLTPRRNVRSALYFEICEEFKKVGIEIPFPQREYTCPQFRCAASTLKLKFL